MERRSIKTGSLVMRNNPLYLQFRQAAESYTIDHVKTATKTRAETIVGVSITDEFFENMKTLLIREKEAESFAVKFDELKAQLTGGGRVWLQTNFPDVEFEKGNIEDKQFVTIWLDGKPDETGKDEGIV